MKYLPSPEVDGMYRYEPFRFSTFNLYYTAAWEVHTQLFISTTIRSYRYSLQNCLFAATYDKILEECECIPYFHTAAWAKYPRICAGERLFCMNNVLRDIGSHTNISSYSTDTSAVSSSNDAGKKLFTFLQKAVSNHLLIRNSQQICTFIGSRYGSPVEQYKLHLMVKKFEML